MEEQTHEGVPYVRVTPRGLVVEDLITGAPISRPPRGPSRKTPTRHEPLPNFFSSRNLADAESPSMAIEEPLPPASTESEVKPDISATEVTEEPSEVEPPPATIEEEIKLPTNCAGYRIAVRFKGDTENTIIPIVQAIEGQIVARGSMSTNSPIVQALINGKHTPGDLVTIEHAGKQITFSLLKIIPSHTENTLAPAA